jgi:hypothetical protein
MCLGEIAAYLSSVAAFTKQRILYLQASVFFQLAQEGLLSNFVAIFRS